MTIKFEICASEPVLARIDKLIDWLGGMTKSDVQNVVDQLKKDVKIFDKGIEPTKP